LSSALWSIGLCGFGKFFTAGRTLHWSKQLFSQAILLANNSTAIEIAKKTQ
jgi:hypothetical protein